MAHAYWLLVKGVFLYRRALTVPVVSSPSPGLRNGRRLRRSCHRRQHPTLPRACVCGPSSPPFRRPSHYPSCGVRAARRRGTVSLLCVRSLHGFVPP